MNFLLLAILFFSALLIAMGVEDGNDSTTDLDLEDGWKGLRDRQVRLFPQDCDDVREQLKRKCYKKLQFQKRYYEDNGEWPPFGF